MSDKIPTHPVQTHGTRAPACVPQAVTMRAYEVYCHLHSPQEAMVTGTCRGGFGVGELVAYLYARSFPRVEWRDRFWEANKGAKNL